MNHTATSWAEPGFRAQRSPALGIIRERLGNGNKNRILDLGQATGTTVDYLSQFRCQVHFMPLDAEPLKPADDAGEGIRTPALAIEPGSKFDLILAWDHFNYLEFDAIAGMVGTLSEHSSPDALLFGLVCTTKQIPNRPMRFTIMDDAHLGYEIVGNGMAPCPRHRPLDLKERLPGFRVARTFLLQNGMQEYLLRYVGPSRTHNPGHAHE